jgi:hypothetical protein
MAKKPSEHDIGFDERGNVIAIGAEATAASDQIVEHPDAVPVIVIATLDGAVGVRVFGPPSEATADLLDTVARTYRRGVEAAKAKRQ